MPSRITLSSTGIPPHSNVVVNGGDLIIETANDRAFPHITFHANAVANAGTVYTISYLGDTPRYHVSIRDGVYLGRRYVHGQWEEDPDDTTERMMQGDRQIGQSYAMDLEPILHVTVP